MSTLLLIRHGQATPFEQDTDRLSERGEVQAREVGAFLASSGVVPTDVIHGPMVRQRRTAELAAVAASERGAMWPAPTLDARLAEYDGDAIIRTLAPLVAEVDPAFAALREEFAARRDAPDRNRSFQRMLEALMDRHVRGDLTHPEVETWAAFKARVQAALSDLVQGVSGRTVVVFTSGGVIGLVVATVLEAPDTAVLRLNWRVQNASITQFTFGGGGRVSLDSYNVTAHLPRKLVTYR